MAEIVIRVGGECENFEPGDVIYDLSDGDVLVRLSEEVTLADGSSLCPRVWASLRDGLLYSDSYSSTSNTIRVAKVIVE